MDNYINLYNSASYSEEQVLTNTIKKMLTNSKLKSLSFNKTQNDIISKLQKKTEKNITNNPQVKHLYDVFKKNRSNYEKNKHLLVITNELKDSFEKTPNIDFSYKEYIIALARRITNETILNSFRNEDHIYKALYKIGKFDGFKFFPKFTIQNFSYNKNYKLIVNEINELAYPKEIILDDKLYNNELFTFSSNYFEKFKTIEAFEIISNKYFESKTSYEDYTNIFFELPKNHNSVIKLKSKTVEFCYFLKHLKESICYNLNYSNIGKEKVFISKKEKTVSYNSISTNINKKDEFHINNTNKLIQKIKNL